MQKLSSRRKEVLNHIKNNPGISLKRLFLDTGKLSKRTGQPKRQSWAHSWSIPETLMKMDLLDRVTDFSFVSNFEKESNLIRYRFYVRPEGMEALANS
jgi:hypothetical protein